jgi:hypothetical protein
MRSIRTTWTAGGALLVLCGVLVLTAPGALGAAGMGVAIAGDVLYAAAVLVFAIGLSREASVVARRPLGLVAMVVVALWPFAARTLWAVLGAGPVPPDDARLSILFGVDTVVSLGAALVAAVRIGRTGTVPRPWRWAPVWALGVTVVTAVIPQLAAVGAPSAGQQLVPLFSVMGVLGLAVRTIGLGILALVLSAQLRPSSVEVLRSR